MTATVHDLAMARAARLAVATGKRHTGAPGVNRHATQLNAGQTRRVLPQARAPHPIWQRTAEGGIAVDRKGRPIVKRWRRNGPHLRSGRAQERRIRRLAWRVEHRLTGTPWADSESAGDRLAPIIPIGSRATHARRGAA